MTHLGYTHAVGYQAKSLAKYKGKDGHSLNYGIIAGNQVSQAQFYPSVNPHWLFPTSFSSMCPKLASKRNRSLNFPETKVKLTGLKWPGSSLLPFLKMELTVTFLESPGSSPDLHNLSKVRVA